MGWLPLLLAVWVVVDVVIVAAIAGTAYKRMRLRAATGSKPRSPLASGRPTSRLVH